MRIGYLCKYAPVELLQAMGAETVRIMPEAADFSQADMLLHANLCSFIKGVFEEIFLCERAADATGDGTDFAAYGHSADVSSPFAERFSERKPFDGILLTNCCDSTRRLYDILKKNYPEKFVCLIDVPRTAGNAAKSFFAGSMETLVEEYAKFSGADFDLQAFYAALSPSADVGMPHGMKGDGQPAETCGHVTEADGQPAEACGHVTEADGQPAEACGHVTEADRQPAEACGREIEVHGQEEGRPGICVGLMGARCSRGVLEMIYHYNIRVLFDLTCTGVDRALKIPTGLTAGRTLLETYAGQLLLQTPCMRMKDISAREKLFKSFSDRLDGIIYHTVKFCDNYSYEYADLCERTDVPIQKFETDATSQCEGQIRTRVEAFLESIAQSKGLPISEIVEKKEAERDRMNDKIRVVGIDSGSTSTNAVILNQDREIEAFAVVRTGAKSGESAEAALKEVLDKAGLARKDVDRIVSTGYGRVSIPFAHRNVTEISCHGKGAHYFYPEVRTVLDIGGQDSKAIRLNEKGDVIDFVMNDKCAAGTGRFLEMMARTLEIDLQQLGEESLHWKQDLDISSMCSVFAESEVISLIANNRETCDIAHGIHKAVANKSISLMKRVGLEPGYMMTGGVAKNPGAVREIEEKLGEKLFICEEPEIVGAVGAAIFGLEELLGNA